MAFAPSFLLPHVGVHHAHDSVHQALHLAGDSEQVQGETPYHEVRVDELLADHRNVVVLHPAAAVLAAPAA